MIDVLFIIDIIVNFRSTHLNPKSGMEIIIPKEIAFQYLKFRFWIDFLAAVPFDTIGNFVMVDLLHQEEITFLGIFGILKLVRVLRLGRIIAYLKVIESVKATFRLSKLIFFLILYLHLVGCFWFFTVNQNETWLPPLDYVYIETNFYKESITF